MKFTEAKLNLFLWGLLIGAFGVSFVLAPTLAILFLAVIFVLFFILKHRKDERQDLFYLLGGIVVSGALCLLFPVIAPLTLSVDLLIIALILIVLVVK